MEIQAPAALTIPRRPATHEPEDAQNPAIALAFTDDKARQDSNWNGVYDAGEPIGTFAFIAVNQVGNGRIVAIVDNSFQDDDSSE